MYCFIERGEYTFFASFFHQAELASFLGFQQPMVQSGFSYFYTDYHAGGDLPGQRCNKAHMLHEPDLAVFCYQACTPTRKSTQRDIFDEKK